MVESVRNSPRQQVTMSKGYKAYAKAQKTHHVKISKQKKNLSPLNHPVKTSKVSFRISDLPVKTS